MSYTCRKATSAANCTSVISLLEQGYSVRDIEKRTGLRKSTVGRIKKGIHTGRENNHGGHPSKLFAHDKPPLFVKFNQKGWILLFRPPISLILPFHTLSIYKQSGEWFMVCHKEESTHVKEDSSSEVARVCSTA